MLRDFDGYSSSSSAASSPLSLEAAFVCWVQSLIRLKRVREADLRQPGMLSPPQLVPYPWQPYQDKAVGSISTCARRSTNGNTFFSSSSSSFHLAPRSLPTSPVKRVYMDIIGSGDPLTEPSIRVLSLDSLSPVLAKEHIGRKSSLWPPLGL